MKKLKYQIRNFFGFSKKETNGFLLLLSLAALLVLIPIFTEIFYNPDEISNRDAIQLDSLVAILEFKASKKTSDSLQEAIWKPALSHFNPNSAHEKQLIEIFGKKIATTIVRFRKKGGRFFQKKDLKKIYGIDTILYNKVEKFILLPPRAYAKDGKLNKSDAHRAVLIKPFDINKADTIALQKIKGIGKVLSARIIKYRNRLGGFNSVNQYKEVYGLDTLVIQELNKLTFVQKDFIPVKLTINAATFSVLAAHPYIGKKNANAIINYRDQHKVFNTLDDLKLIRSIPLNELLKMMPYLDL